MTDPFLKKTYYAMTLDPVHIGTGGYRLGRVDNTITREPGTNIPKIPGSSISGATRAYTAMAIQSTAVINDLIYTTSNGLLAVNEAVYKKMKYLRPKYIFNNNTDHNNPQNKLVKTVDTKTPEIEKDNMGKDKYYSCAGKGADDGEGHCGAPDCEVCVPFGFSKNGNSFQGLAQFFDARILFFPVHSMIGPVWITSPSILNALTSADTFAVDKEKFKAININNREQIGKLNFGWLMIEQDTPSDIPINFSAFPDAGQSCNICNKIINRTFLVSDKVFSRIVNDNLEVRTSVAINPATGAAEDGALFTYEAIPRSTIMWFEVVYNKPEYFRINGQEIEKCEVPGGTLTKTKADIAWIETNVKKGLKYLETLGVGGMNTRGMGRLRVLNIGG